MATAYHTSAPHPWDQAVPAMAEHSPPIPDASYAFSPAQTRDSYGPSTAAYPRTTQTTMFPDYDFSSSGRGLGQKSNGAVLGSANGSSDDRQQRRPSVPSTRALGPGRKRSEGSGLSAGDVDDSAWIHRDKLAQIESRELAAAGIRVRGSSRNSRSASRSSTKRARSRDPWQSDEQTTPTLPPFDERQPDHAHHATPDDYAEMLQEDPSYDRSVGSHKGSMSRPITSRIPIPKSNATPSSGSMAGRESPMSRNRRGTGSGDGPSTPKGRPRSQSLGSQVIMDEAVGSRQAASTRSRSRPTSSHLQTHLDSKSPRSISGSPPKSRAPGKTGVSSGARRSTNPRAVSKPRTVSATKRDSPKPGSTARPATNVNRPEGEAPWIATMYKPDPRLPQDQQILPTHAKRMMQEQWEKQGKTGDAYDRNFNLLNDNDLAKMGAFPDEAQSSDEQIREVSSKQSAEQLPTPTQPPTQPLPQPPPSTPASLPAEPPTPSPASRRTQTPNRPTSAASPRSERSVDHGSWPLESNRGDRNSLRPTTSGTTGGGYKITPTIPLPSPTPEQRPVSRPVSRPASQTQSKRTVQRMPDIDEKADNKKDKGCACCIVM